MQLRLSLFWVVSRDRHRLLSARPSLVFPQDAVCCAPGDLYAQHALVVAIVPILKAGKSSIFNNNRIPLLWVIL